LFYFRFLVEIKLREGCHKYVSATNSSLQVFKVRFYLICMAKLLTIHYALIMIVNLRNETFVWRNHLDTKQQLWQMFTYFAIFLLTYRRPLTWDLLKRVWRYQRGNRNSYIEEGQTIQWPKEKGERVLKRSTKQNTETDRANKGNNKITELRTILQRESQNS
jgi:hypothetical protein